MGGALISPDSGSRKDNNRVSQASFSIRPPRFPLISQGTAPLTHREQHIFDRVSRETKETASPTNKRNGRPYILPSTGVKRHMAEKEMAYFLQNIPLHQRNRLDHCFIFQGQFCYFLPIHRNRKIEHNLPNPVTIFLLLRI